MVIETWSCYRKTLGIGPPPPFPFNNWSIYYYYTLICLYTLNILIIVGARALNSSIWIYNWLYVISVYVTVKLNSGLPAFCFHIKFITWIRLIPSIPACTSANIQTYLEVSRPRYNYFDLWVTRHPGVNLQPLTELPLCARSVNRDAFLHFLPPPYRCVKSKMVSIAITKKTDKINSV